jgi:hypothetical protein
MLTFCCHGERTYNTCFNSPGYQGSDPFSFATSIPKTINVPIAYATSIPKTINVPIAYATSIPKIINVPIAYAITLPKSQCGTLNTSDDTIMPNTVCDLPCDKAISCGTTLTTDILSPRQCYVLLVSNLLSEQLRKV